MKLWLLRPLEQFDTENRLIESPWNPWYDKAFGFVIRAETETEAREIAAQECGRENEDAWLNPEFSFCVPLLPEGDKGLVLMDYHSA